MAYHIPAPYSLLVLVLVVVVPASTFLRSPITGHLVSAPAQGVWLVKPLEVWAGLACGLAFSYGSWPGVPRSPYCVTFFVPRFPPSGSGHLHPRRPATDVPFPLRPFGPVSFVPDTSMWSAPSWSAMRFLFPAIVLFAGAVADLGEMVGAHFLVWPVAYLLPPLTGHLSTFASSYAGRAASSGAFVVFFKFCFWLF